MLEISLHHSHQKEKTMPMLKWWFILCIRLMAYSFGYCNVYLNASLSHFSKTPNSEFMEIYALSIPYLICIDFQYTMNANGRSKPLQCWILHLQYYPAYIRMEKGIKYLSREVWINIHTSTCINILHIDHYVLYGEWLWI